MYRINMFIENFAITKATSTLSDLQYALTSAVYDGSAKSVTVTTSKNGVGTITVKYDKANPFIYLLSVNTWYHIIE
ncbi:MAG: MBG domain-containing protein [Prevotellaceae bacterium]|nr:MBG domain-containing protein [Prevotellaceae bacterium]